MTDRQRLLLAILVARSTQDGLHATTLEEIRWAVRRHDDAEPSDDQLREDLVQLASAHLVSVDGRRGVQPTWKIEADGKVALWAASRLAN